MSLIIIIPAKIGAALGNSSAPSFANILMGKFDVKKKFFVVENSI